MHIIVHFEKSLALVQAIYTTSTRCLMLGKNNFKQKTGFGVYNFFQTECASTPPVVCVQLYVYNFLSLTTVMIRYRTSVYESWSQTQETGSIPLLADAASKGKSDDRSNIYRLSQLAGVIMDDKIAALPGASVQNLRKIAPPDRREARWARRTLHK